MCGRMHMFICTGFLKCKRLYLEKESINRVVIFFISKVLTFLWLLWLLSKYIQILWHFPFFFFFLKKCGFASNSAKFQSLGYIILQNYAYGLDTLILKFGRNRRRISNFVIFWIIQKMNINVLIFVKVELISQKFLHKRQSIQQYLLQLH